MKGASLFEVFAGIQGEGLLLGVSQIFIRFAGCNLRCRYCDTKYALKVPKRCRFEIRDKRWEVVDNPILPSRLIEAIKGFGMECHSISLTGGEPLLQADFILEFLTLIPHPFSLLPIYLETNATLPKELKKIISHLDIIAMDIKLPSVSGEGEFWKEHKEFLSIAKEGKVFIKVVINRRTRLNEVEMAVSLVKEVDNRIPFILQPDFNSPPSKDWLYKCRKIASISLKDVRIIPQVHKLMGWR